MGCKFPVLCWRSIDGRNPETGKWPLVSDPKKGHPDLKVMRPCGQCIGCRLRYSQSWAMRCLHELQFWPTACFITLTYDNEKLKFGKYGFPTLTKGQRSEMTLFLKRLRKKLHPLKISYKYSAEYGDQTLRPHYHLLLYGYDFKSDRRVWKKTSQGFVLYRSATLNNLWSHGYCVIGGVDFDSAAYVASYNVKKLNGEKADSEYLYKDRVPPYSNTSVNFGKRWIQKYADQVYDWDYINTKNGFKLRPPRYYDEFFKNSDDYDFEKIIKQREKIAEEFQEKNKDYRPEISAVVLQDKYDKKIKNKI